MNNINDNYKSPFCDSLKSAKFSRVQKIKTHKWTADLPQEYSDSPIVSRIKETSLVTEKVFTGASSSLWKEKDLFIEGGVGVRSVAEKELSLLVNEKHLAKLRFFGGEEIFLENPGRDKIHCMFFKKDRFFSNLSEVLNLLGPFLECKREGKEQKMRIFNAPSKEVAKQVSAAIDMGLLRYRSDEDLVGEDGVDFESLQELFGADLDEDDIKFLVMYQPLSVAKKKEGSETVSVICGGSGVWFSTYQSIIARFLLNGVDVAAFSWRGYEYSEGVPTDTKLTQDLETVCHYLKEEWGIPDEQVLLYASCMGLGPAARYLENHPKSNLFIDRSFASLSSFSKSYLRKEGKGKRSYLRSKVIKLILPKLVDFEPLPCLKKVEGKMALVTAKKDGFLREQAKILKEKLPDAYHITSPKKFGHSGNWLKDPNMIIKFEKFLALQKCD